MTLITIDNYTMWKKALIFTWLCQDHPSICRWLAIYLNILSYFHLLNTKKAHLKQEILHHSHFFVLQNEQLLLMLKQC